ncbi:MAG: 23S rRNA-specific endonuclease VapC20 [Chloroflexi bacterium]|nr:23S rRNA-specific endonuclease VapC20 [Chloroflexota bacterium]
MEAVEDFQNLIPLLEVDWITADQHRATINTLIAYNRRRLSLVDCSSFVTMRHLGINKAFTFDKHFAEQGFEVVG